MGAASDRITKRYERLLALRLVLRPQTTSTNLDRELHSIYNEIGSVNIGQPAAAGMPLRMADLVTVYGTLSANFTLHEMFLLYLCIDTR